MILTITERWHGAESVTWTARHGRHVLATVTCPMEFGMVDSDTLRTSIAEATGADATDVRFERKRSDGHRVVPRLASVELTR